MSVDRTSRAALVLGVGALASTLFALMPGSQSRVDFIEIRDLGLVVVLALGALSVLGVAGQPVRAAVRRYRRPPPRCLAAGRALATLAPRRRRSIDILAFSRRVGNVQREPAPAQRVQPEQPDALRIVVAALPAAT